MNIYTEELFAGDLRKEWNCCHPSGYTGLVIEIFKHEKIYRREFGTNGLRHRLDGPAYETFYSDGQISCRQYWVDGKLHRPPADGPALESFNMKGLLTYQEYWVDGNQEEWGKH